MLEGAARLTYDDGTAEIITAGQFYVIPAGHVPEILGDIPAVMVEFSDDDEDAK
jgi:quercetin dioxygenase-like cupin family protein